MLARRHLFTPGALLAAAIGAAPARAQSTETAETPVRSRFLRQVEGTVRGLDRSLARLGLQPSLSGPAPGCGLTPGLSFWTPRAYGTGIDVFGSVSHSFRGDQLLELRLGRPPRRPGQAPSRRSGFERIPGFVSDEAGSGRFFFYAEASQVELGSGRFLRGASDPLRERSLDVVGGLRLSPHLAASVRVGRLGITPRAGASALGRAPFSLESAAPGLAWRRDYFRVSSEIAFDDRDEPGRPRRGHFASLTFDHYAAGQGAGFDRLALDARRYQALGSPRHVLALRGVASFASADGGHVPFYLQHTLGGSDLLRGYEAHRFAGDRLLAASLEYRFEAAPWLELAAFSDGGRAWAGHPSLASGGFRKSFGAGLRLKSAHGVGLRLDAARGDEGTRLHLRLGYAF